MVLVIIHNFVSYKLIFLICAKEGVYKSRIKFIAAILSDIFHIEIYFYVPHTRVWNGAKSPNENWTLCNRKCNQRTERIIPAKLVSRNVNGYSDLPPTIIDTVFSLPINVPSLLLSTVPYYRCPSHSYFPCSFDCCNCSSLLPVSIMFY